MNYLMFELVDLYNALYEEQDTKTLLNSIMKH